MTGERSSFDVVIIGGAMIGSAVAWWLARDPDFDGSILVIERDPSFEFASTSHTNSCIRMQFGTEINVAISRFGREFIGSFREFAGEDAPEIHLDDFGYLYLARDEPAADRLRTRQAHRPATWPRDRPWAAARRRPRRPARHRCRPTWT